ncbi:hypothetical protein RHGRI_021148 [Rhododendron griersonianum]|uniref:Protein kinase domain-containing protein n=1 Tax=Rhododendron griersonianum TaxID=479676 RepID=A0AAV6JL09_9ERIC|nr:hypothetical protein RHGRI_021148 [Rhododendron griersonianum]
MLQKASVITLFEMMFKIKTRFGRDGRWVTLLFHENSFKKPIKQLFFLDFLNLPARTQTGNSVELLILLIICVSMKAEVIFLGQLRHQNLVKLIGYCCEEEERLLVYEFMPRGSLENHLFKRMSVSLPWGTRLKIAIGSAKGLAFLHGAESPVIYRDFKTSNILLDSEFNAKLSDFGLAKMGPEGSDTHVTTRVMGTYGYAAPEYVNTGHLTTRSDIYSFGVVLLELLTGRRALDKTRPKSEQNLVDWSKPYLTSSRRLRFIMDPRLSGQYSVKGAKEMALLALQCVSLIPKDRPKMPVIIETLESLQKLTDMAVTCGQWPASPNPGKASAKGGRRENKGAIYWKKSPVAATPKK